MAMKFRIILLVLLAAAVVLMGCAQKVEKKAETGAGAGAGETGGTGGVGVGETPKPTEEEKDVAQIETTIDEVENLLNSLNELDNISFEI